MQKPKNCICEPTSWNKYQPNEWDALKFYDINSSVYKSDPNLNIKHLSTFVSGDTNKIKEKKNVTKALKLFFCVKVFILTFAYKNK